VNTVADMIEARIESEARAIVVEMQNRMWRAAAVILDAYGLPANDHGNEGGRLQCALLELYGRAATGSSEAQAAMLRDALIERRRAAIAKLITEGA
jgi:hypothetical protein